MSRTIKDRRLQRQKHISSIRWLHLAARRLLYDDRRMYGSVWGPRCYSRLRRASNLCITFNLYNRVINEQDDKSWSLAASETYIKHQMAAFGCAEAPV